MCVCVCVCVYVCVKKRERDKGKYTAVEGNRKEFVKDINQLLRRYSAREIVISEELLSC